MSIGENIKRILKEKGVLQKEVAIVVGLNQGNYNRMEHGQREPSIASLKKLSDRFGVSADHLIYHDKDLPKLVVIKDKAANELLRLIS